MKISIILLALLMTIRCGSGTPVEYANVCDKANDEKRVQVVGYLDNNGSAMCSSGYGKPMHCPVSFKSDLAAEKFISADIDKGKGASEIDVYEEGKGLKIKDDKGEIIDRTQKVKIIADVKVYETPPANTAGCYVMVNNIEKQ